MSLTDEHKPTTAEEREAVAKAARAATGGDWSTNGVEERVIGMTIVVSTRATSVSHVSWSPNADDAKYIAAASPSFVLRLLEDSRRSEARADGAELRAAALHIALEEACNEFEDAAGYVPEYFVEKYGYREKLAELRAPLMERQQPTPSNREQLGRMVRDVWIAWARQQPYPKPSWLLPWEDLDEPDREVDRRIGETIARVGALAAGADVSQLVDERDLFKLRYEQETQRADAMAAEVTRLREALRAIASAGETYAVDPVLISPAMARDFYDALAEAWTAIEKGGA